MSVSKLLNFEMSQHTIFPTKQDRIDVFRAAIGISIYSEEFDHQEKTNIYQSGILRFHLPALSLHTSSTLISLYAMWMLE